MEMNQGPMEPLEEEGGEAKRTFIPLQAKIELVMKAAKIHCTMGYRLMEHDSQNGRQKFVETQALLLFP